MKTKELVNALKAIYYSNQLGIESLKEIVVHRINKLLYGTKKALEIKKQKQYQSIEKEYLKNNIWDFNGIKLPKWTNDFSQDILINNTYLDTLLVYCKYNDNYDSKLVDKLDLILPEGTYGYKNDKVDITVKEGDIVIDSGAWIGDFSAYASVKGAKVYAFEPSKKTVNYLKITQELNKNIHIVEKGLGDKEETAILENDSENSGANKIVDSNYNKNAEKIELTTIDDFVVEQKLERIDFIKADIEGFERFMLKGANKTLKNFAPKLAICTYHLPDDPQVLAKIILDANPNYTIVQKKSKLYAAVK